VAALLLADAEAALASFILEVQVVASAAVLQAVASVVLVAEVLAVAAQVAAGSIQSIQLKKIK
jgi:hypothetical protein